MSLRGQLVSVPADTVITSFGNFVRWETDKHGGPAAFAKASGISSGSIERYCRAADPAELNMRPYNAETLAQALGFGSFEQLDAAWRSTPLPPYPTKKAKAIETEWLEESSDAWYDRFFSMVINSLKQEDPKAIDGVATAAAFLPEEAVANLALVWIAGNKVPVNFLVAGISRMGRDDRRVLAERLAEFGIAASRYKPEYLAALVANLPAEKRRLFEDSLEAIKNIPEKSPERLADILPMVLESQSRRAAHRRPKPGEQK